MANAKARYRVAITTNVCSSALCLVMGGLGKGFESIYNQCSAYHVKMSIFSPYFYISRDYATSSAHCSFRPSRGREMTRSSSFLLNQLYFNDEEVTRDLKSVIYHDD